MTQTLRKSNPKSSTADKQNAQAADQIAKIDRFIPPDVDAELTPKIRAFVHQLFDRIEDLTRRVEKLGTLLAAKLTPQNSSLPPSSVHPHDKRTLNGNELAQALFRMMAMNRQDEPSYANRPAQCLSLFCFSGYASCTAPLVVLLVILRRRDPWGWIPNSGKPPQPR